MADTEAAHDKRMLSDWFSAALQTSRKCGRWAGVARGLDLPFVN